MAAFCHTDLIAANSAWSSCQSAEECSVAVPFSLISCAFSATKAFFSACLPATHPELGGVAGGSVVSVALVSAHAVRAASQRAA